MSLSNMFTGMNMPFGAAAFFLFLSTALFGEWYFGSGRDKKRFRILLAAAAASSTGILSSGNWLLFVLFLEILTLSLWSMISMKDPRAAMVYLLSQLTAAGLILVGAAGVFSDTGSLAIGPVPEPWKVFFLAGFGIKAAFPLLHFWLPEAHGKAPSPASALLSGFAVKTGILGLIRAFPEPFTPLVLIGTVMALFGAFMAVFPRDIKRVLAYSTMSHLGFMTTAIGAGATSIAAAYAFSHAIIKGTLFMSAGILEKTFGTRDISALEGIGRSHFATVAPLVTGAFFAAGLPGTASYLLKNSVISSLGEAAHWLQPFLLASAGMLASGYLLNITVPLFFKGETEKQAESGKGSGFAISAILILLLVLSTDSFFSGILEPIRSVPETLSGSGKPGSFLATVAAGIIVLLARRRITGIPQQGLPDIRIYLSMEEGPLCAL
ncbi:MAG TPA: proton-conducting transporter membrane subunit, partial [Synergistales bacterium]|nr:proton-conducting transporter membrane subunit [Synergistales bacterium]